MPNADTDADTGPAAPTRPAFAARAVERSVIDAVLDQARRAPSGVNTQPWKVCVLQAQARDRLVARVCQQLPALCAQADLQARFWQQYRQLPGQADWPGPHWERCGDGFLAQADAAFGAGAIRTEQDLRDYAGLYGAPVALVCTMDRALGLGSVLDYGMFVQNVVTAAAVRGLRVEVLAGWNGFSDMVLGSVPVDDGDMLVAVLALGHGEPVRSDPTAVPPAAVLARAQASTHWHD